MLQKMTRTNEKGFTLIELMIVIAIIGILAAIAIPNFISYRNKAFCSAAEADAKTIVAALADYFAVPANVTFADGDPIGRLPNVNLSGAGASLNTATVAGAATAGSAAAAITVTVTDNSTRCPSGAAYTLVMGGSSGSWQ